MGTSIFMEKTEIPTNESLWVHLKGSANMWMTFRDFVFEKYPSALEEWNFPGNKYGWSFRIKDKKRAIIYLLPRDGYFKVAFVFGQKATTQILESEVSEQIKTELSNARVYAEGRGIRIEITDDSKIEDIKKLIEIKLLN